MRRGALVALAAAAVWAPPAHACDVQATPTLGAAPLKVTFTALCDAGSYSWSFGDGRAGAGPTVTHVFAAGRFDGTLTAGEETSTLPQVTSVKLGLSAPRTAAYHSAITLAGRVVPGPARVRIYRGRSLVTLTSTGPEGRYRVHVRVLGPGRYTARVLGVSTAEHPVRVRPVLETALVGTATVGKRLTLVAHLRPAKAGTLHVRAGTLSRRGSTLRVRLDTSAGKRIRVTVRSAPAKGWTATARTLSVPVRDPDLALGATGAAVHALEQRLASLHYALAGAANATFGEDTADAVIAFEKVAGLPRTGKVDATVWKALATATTPAPRYPSGDHVEVDKVHQVLLLVRGGETALVVPVSTAGLPGMFTPDGRFAVYRKVTGWDPSPLGELYDPLYFVAGYAIHGYPSVPTYPASHGCVRVPMWVSPRLYATIPYGEPVYVY